MSSPSPTLDVVVRRAAAELADAGVLSPEADVAELASFVLDVDRAEVARRVILRQELDPQVQDRLTGLVHGRASRVPLQHLTGRAYFRGLTLAVGPGVFVPRPETESVVSWAIDEIHAARARGVDEPLVLDLCSGSGAIALAIKDEIPQSRAHGVEMSALAHAWGVANRDRLALDVDLREGDATEAFSEFEGQADVVVSNPPYIPTEATPNDPEVRLYDPPEALYGGSSDGLLIPARVAARAAWLLKAGGVLVMEHADSQGHSLPAALGRTGQWDTVGDRRDLTGRPRAVVAVRARPAG